jgi:predicted component of type VI protein secretion system
MANVPVDAAGLMLHGVPTWLFLYRGKRLGLATGWRGLGPLEGAVAAEWDKIWPANAVGSTAGGEKSGKSSTD